MTDFPEGSDNFDRDVDNIEPKANKKPNIILDLLMGVGISAAAYGLIITLLAYAKILGSIKGIISFIILGAFVFLTVKFFRTEHIAAATIMLVLILPCILFMMLFGACLFVGLSI
jgi:hypothetical protein